MVTGCRASQYARDLAHVNSVNIFQPVDRYAQGAAAVGSLPPEKFPAVLLLP
jgi:hypothetical protein